MPLTYHTIIFDLGNVLIAWNPRLIYRDVFATSEELDYFFTEVANLAWNEEQDRGRSIAEGTATLIAQHPKYEQEIRMYYDRWTEAFPGAIGGSVDILKNLHSKGQHRLLALTNWSAELFPWARAQYDFLQLFEDIMVSGEVGLKKPNPAIYQLLSQRYELGDFAGCLFIDDSQRNVDAAQDLGLESVRFQDPVQLKLDLEQRGVISSLQSR
ncbi:MAG: HAD-IA family hydrolase [Bacteroidota bacterium]